MRKLFAWLFLAALFAALPASAQVQKATVKIDGMI